MAAFPTIYLLGPFTLKGNLPISNHWNHQPLIEYFLFNPFLNTGHLAFMIHPKEFWANGPMWTRNLNIFVSVKEKSTGEIDSKVWGHAFW